MKQELISSQPNIYLKAVNKNIILISLQENTLETLSHVNFLKKLN